MKKKDEMDLYHLGLLADSDDMTSTASQKE